MRRIATLLLLAAMPLLCALASGEGTAYAVGDVPNVRLTDTRLHVSDPNGLLHAVARDTIDAMLTQLEQTTGIEVAVVMLPSIGQADAFQFGVDLFRTWGIGKEKSDNGLLVLYVGDQRTIRFITGYGIEGSLPDAICKRIQQRHMVPRFKQGDTDGGMVAGMRAVCATLDGTMEPEAEDDAQSMLLPLLLVLGVVLMALVMSGVISRRPKPCPHCKQRALRHMSTDYYRGDNGHRYRKDIYICGKCGRVVVENTDMGDDDHHRRRSDMSSFLGGMLLGSMLHGGRRGGGGFSGGGFSGGSFGGGSTGGGGAGSDW